VFAVGPGWVDPARLGGANGHVLLLLLLHGRRGTAGKARLVLGDRRDLDPELRRLVQADVAQAEPGRPEFSWNGVLKPLCPGTPNRADPLPALEGTRVRFPGAREIRTRY
jgi:hypothetical protein